MQQMKQMKGLNILLCARKARTGSGYEKAKSGRQKISSKKFRCYVAKKGMKGLSARGRGENNIARGRKGSRRGG